MNGNDDIGMFVLKEVLRHRRDTDVTYGDIWGHMSAMEKNRVYSKAELYLRAKELDDA